MPVGIESLGRALLVIGAIIFVLGLILIALGRIPFFGRLPGDIFIQRDNGSVWIPIVSMIVLSIALTVILNLIGWFLRR
jgi:uncharacterized protein HemY